MEGLRFTFSIKLIHQTLSSIIECANHLHKQKVGFIKTLSSIIEYANHLHKQKVGFIKLYLHKQKVGFIKTLSSYTKGRLHQTLSS
jgi:hypothetical protein